LRLVVLAKCWIALLDGSSCKTLNSDRFELEKIEDTDLEINHEFHFHVRDFDASAISSAKYMHLAFVKFEIKFLFQVECESTLNEISEIEAILRNFHQMDCKIGQLISSVRNSQNFKLLVATENS
jgi:hypothetical protein